MAGLQAFLAFTETVKHGSFAGAARAMGISPSAVAKSIGRLEEDLGLRLFHRTTRQVTLTGDGRDLHLRCKHIADEIEALHDEAAGARGEASGTLRINAPVVIGHQLVVPALAELRQRHPKLALEVELSDRYVDLVSEGLDAVVRIGHLKDSTLVARRIGAQSLVVCGAPDYLARRGVPRKPADLGGHTCLLFRIPSTGLIRPWQFQDGGEALELRPESPVVMNDGEALLAGAVAGMGLVQIPDYLAAGAIDTGRLVEALADHRAPPMPISVIHPFARRVTPRVRAFIEVLAEHAGQSSSPAGTPG